MQLHYNETGNPEGTPLIILHGVFGASDNWATVGRHLGENYRVFMVDQRNHGRSPQTEAFSYQLMANDIAEFVAGHELQDPVVIGHSMGGKVAMKFALQHPEKLSKLIVVDMATRAYNIDHHRQILKGLNAIPVADLKSRSAADKQLAEYIPEFSIRQFLLKNLYRADNGGFAWRINLPVLTTKIADVGGPLEEEGQTFEKPVLFIGGGKSKYIEPADHEAIKSYFPQAQIETIAEAGHWIHAEAPQAFIEKVRSFVG